MKSRTGQVLFLALKHLPSSKTTSKDTQFKDNYSGRTSLSAGSRIGFTGLQTNRDLRLNKSIPATMVE